MPNINTKINIIGAGLAGVETANFLARYNLKVNLYEMRPIKFDGAHHTDLFGELVCSNSLKSTRLDNACGLLKEEMRTLSSLIMEASQHASIEGGSSLNVDREKFAKYITEKITSNPNISIFHEEIKDLNKDELYVVATGPLGSDAIINKIKEISGDDSLFFFDASAPIIKKESINMNIAYFKSRYDDGPATYLNCPLSKDEYYQFVDELVNAKTALIHDFDKNYFEGCMPIEAMAKRGPDTLRFGPLKPKGLWKNADDHSYAIVQLRQDSLIGDLYNLVGFQTNLTYPEQKRVFSLIPGLENAEFVRYGLMHRNSYICAPKVINPDFSMKNDKNIYIAGQFSGVEGYVESASSGIYVAIMIAKRLLNIDIEYPRFTMLGSLMNYVANASKENFSPMNANYSLLYGVNKTNKLLKAEEALNYTKKFYNNFNDSIKAKVS